MEWIFKLLPFLKNSNANEFKAIIAAYKELSEVYKKERDEHQKKIYEYQKKIDELNDIKSHTTNKEEINSIDRERDYLNKILELTIENRDLKEEIIFIKIINKNGN